MKKQGKVTFPETIFPVLKTIENSTIIIACSGGVDSMVLLDIVRNFNKAKIVVAHVHHGLRETADRDEKIVTEYSKKHTLQFESLKVDIKKEAKKTKTSIEECARNIRKSWLEEIRKKHDAKYILTAHHADDQTETILYRLIKGTGITGLVGIEEISGYYFRPFLSVKKEELFVYAKKNKIPFGHDETNDDTNIPRNLIRHTILPEVEKINPEAGKSLARLSEQSRLLKDGFNEFFEKELKICPLEKGDFDRELSRTGQGGLSFDRFHSLPKSFQHELLRYWYEQANGSTHGLSVALMEELDRFLSTRNGGKKEIKNLLLRKEKGIIVAENLN